MFDLKLVMIALYRYRRRRIGHRHREGPHHHNPIDLTQFLIEIHYRFKKEIER